MIKKMQVRDLETNSVHTVVSIDFDTQVVVMESIECGRTRNVFNKVVLLNTSNVNTTLFTTLTQLIEKKHSEGVKINGILMNPNTWVSIAETMLFGDLDTFNGITIYRSIDIQENEFKLF